MKTRKHSFLIKVVLSLLCVFMFVTGFLILKPKIFVLANEVATTTQTVAPVEITPDYTWYSADASEYSINSVEQLVGLANITNGKDGKTKFNFLNKTVKLTANLTFKDNAYWYYKDTSGILYDYRIGQFAGKFDGQGNTIKGLKFYHTTATNVHMYLFESITAEGGICNLTLDSVTANINDRDRFGFIVLDLYGTATNCHVNNVKVTVDLQPPSGTTGYGVNSGAMFGTITTTTVDNCSANVVDFTFTGTDNSDNVGSLIGISSGTEEKRSIIKNCTFI